MSALDDVFQDNDFTNLEKDIYSELENMKSPQLVIDYMNASRSIAKLAKSRMLGLIGEDENAFNLPPIVDMAVQLRLIQRNKVRDELRRKVNEL